MSYKQDIEDALEFIKHDVSIIIVELNTISDMQNIDDMKAALEDVTNTAYTLLEEL